MRRLLFSVCLSLLLVSCAKDRSLEVSEIRVELTSVGGSRARITVASMNKSAYYSYVFVSRMEPNFDAPAEEIARDEIARMEDSYGYFANLGVEGSFLDVFCYQGSRQFPISSLSQDADYKFIVFQLHPKTHALIGSPLVTPFHTRDIPVREMNFDVQVEGSAIRIVPSDNTLSYFWDYEDDETILDDYFSPQEYLYELMEMYDEYGFLESMLSRGPERWDFADDIKMKPGQAYTLVIAGCEDAEFTTAPQLWPFRYNGPGNVEFL